MCEVQDSLACASELQYPIVLVCARAAWMCAKGSRDCKSVLGGLGFLGSRV